MTARARRSTTRPIVVTIGEELTIQYAAESTAQLTTALEQAATPTTTKPTTTASTAPALRLDLTAVQELDTAGLQVLLWADREARGRGLSLDVLASEPVTDVLHLAGVELTALRGAAAPVLAEAGEVAQ